MKSLKSILFLVFACSILNSSCTKEDWDSGSSSNFDNPLLFNLMLLNGYLIKVSDPVAIHFNPNNTVTTTSTDPYYEDLFKGTYTINESRSQLKIINNNGEQKTFDLTVEENEYVLSEINGLTLITSKQ